MVGTQAQTTLTRFGDTVRAGVVKGDSVNDMVRTLRGTQASGFSDGVFGRSPEGYYRRWCALEYQTVAT